MDTAIILALIFLFVLFGIFWLVSQYGGRWRDRIIYVPSNGGGHGRHDYVVGGCAGTRYGCCPDGRTSRANKQGTNC